MVFAKPAQYSASRAKVNNMDKELSLVLMMLANIDEINKIHHEVLNIQLPILAWYLIEQLKGAEFVPGEKPDRVVCKWTH